MADTRQIELTIESRLENVALVGVAVNGICGYLGFSAQEQAHVELCVVEAVSNSVRHAYRGEPGHLVTVRLLAADDGIEIRVLDWGLPVPEEYRVPRDVEIDPSDIAGIAEGGRGTFLMHALMDRITYGLDGDANLLLMTKALPAVQAS